MTDKSASKRRVGILGGTFDPIHYGHLRAAEEARERFALERVIFIPAFIPPHKGTLRVTESRHRIEMVKRAIQGNELFEVSEVECAREGASYSVETIRQILLMEGPGLALYFILGIDAFQMIHTWRSYQELFNLTNWIVLKRPGYAKWGKEALPKEIAGLFHYDNRRKVWVHESGHKVHFCKFRSLEISATEIRRLIERGKSVRYLIPEEVRNYIETHGLYKRYRPKE